jgi:hypothetical protein
VTLANRVEWGIQLALLAVLALLLYGWTLAPGGLGYGALRPQLSVERFYLGGMNGWA